MSYKRGVAAGSVDAVKTRLEKEGYWCWFDREDIRMSERDWQASIERGIADSAAVVLFFSQEASESPYIQHEIKTALRLGKPFYVLQVARMADLAAALARAGLPDRQQVEDYTDAAQFQAQLDKLIRELERDGIRVTRHERRQQRNRDNPLYRLHQRYLHQLAERVGMVSLAHINAEDKRQTYLEDVYIDSPTGLSISVEVHNWHVVAWGISDAQDRPSQYFQEELAQIAQMIKDEDGPVAFTKETQLAPHKLGLEADALLPRIAEVERAIDAYRAKHPDAKADDSWFSGNPWRNGAKYNLILHLADLAHACSRLVILGKPGSGKSTFVKYLALCLAGEQLQDWTRSASLAQLPNWTHRDLTPIYVELRRFVASSHFPTGDAMPTAQHLWDYIQADLLGAALADYAPELRQDLEEGLALLILDGLDEVPYEEGKLKLRQQQLIALAKSLHASFGKSRVIVASRPYAYEGWTLPDYHDFTIADFKNEHRQALIQRLYQASGMSEADAGQHAKQLTAQINAKGIHAELKDRPLFITMMASLALRQGGAELPERRGALYRQTIFLLLDRWTSQKANLTPLTTLLGDKTLDDLYARLMALAYEVHSRYGERPGTPEIDESVLMKHLRPLGRHVAVDVISYLSENAGVLVCPGQNTERDIFHFAHRTFQEYLAAEELVRRCAEADSFALIREQIVSKPDQWRVPCVLAGDVLVDTERPSALWKVIDDLLDDETPPAQPAGETPGGEGWWSVWLASAIVEEQKLHTQTKLGKGEKAIREALIEVGVSLIETPQALNPPERAQVGRVLSLLGDPRPGVGLIKSGVGAGLPDIEWCDIPAGTFLYGDNKEPRTISYSFKMAKYLITYAQYQCFLDAPDFDAVAWWADMPPDVVKRYNQEWPISNHPRESVTWYQAVAFTRWLTARYRAVGLLTAEEEIRLPTEFEWEYAARGTDGREYPWGDGYRVGYANCDEQERGVGPYSLDCTTAVGSYPQGASPFGLLDMSGNVWEWCLNKYDDTGDISIDVTGADRALCGGSFINPNDGLLAAFRIDYSPDSYDDFIGIRCALFSP